jgi:hypothetical protein
MRQGYVIPNTAHHDLSPDARLDVRYGPAKVPGRAVNTSRARTAPRTMQYLLTTTEGTRMFRRLSKSKAGRRRLVDIYYRRALAVGLRMYGDTPRREVYARRERDKAKTRIKAQAIRLKQLEQYARALRLAPKVDRTSALASLFMPARPVAVQGTCPALARDLDNVTTATNEGYRPNYLRALDRPTIRTYTGGKLVECSSNGTKVIS